MKMKTPTQIVEALPMSKYKNKKLWMLIKDQLENHTLDSVPFSYAKNISILTDNDEIEVKTRKEFNDTITTLMTKLGPESDNIRIKYQINYDKLVTKVEEKTQKLFSI